MPDTSRAVQQLHEPHLYARQLYGRHGDLPILDYHCHLPPERILSNAPFRDLTDLWIDHDHYKWRAMRIAGEPENVCSGDAAPRDKFLAFARTAPKMAAGPMQVWCKGELERSFGITKPLIPANADAIWEEANAQLATPHGRPRALLESAGVRVVCTTDDPADSLDHHRAFAADPAAPFRMLPTFRPDGALCLGTRDQFARWLSRLEVAADVSLTDAVSVLSALRRRFEAFADLGCQVSDHGIERCYPEVAADADANRIFDRLRKGGIDGVDPTDLDRWRGRVMREVAEWDAEHGWTMLLHLGARRNNNSRVAEHLGFDAGCDSIGDFDQGASLVAFLDRLNSAQALPRTVLFNSNPRDTLMFATIAGSYFEAGVPGKVQIGPPWWFLDHEDGIVAHIDATSAVGVLATSLGMVTDSRSFLSSVRHDYFRRTVARRLADRVTDGRIDPAQTDLDALCHALFYGNAATHFGWGTP